MGFNSGFKSAILSDINPHIIKFYRMIQSNEITSISARSYLEKEGELLRNAKDNGYEHYKTVKIRFNEGFDRLDFIFLSRAGFNGMIRFNKKGEWNIPFCKKPERFSPSYITKICNQIKQVSSVMTDNWHFSNLSFEKIIKQAEKDDFIYSDPPYFGRYVDYYNGWTIKDEENLFELLSETKAKFILSTWHHNDYRENDMINRFWKHFNIATYDHFYHNGGNLENRRSVVEALVYNFDSHIDNHKHSLKQVFEQPVLF